MAYRSSAKANATSGSVTATPPGVAAHDYLAAIFSHDSGSTTGATGWNQIDQLNYGPDNNVATLFDKYDATGSDSFQFASNTSFGLALVCSAWSGRDNTSPRSATPVRTADSGPLNSPISASLTGITATTGDDIGVLIGVDQTDGGARYTFSQITNYTERQDGVNEDYVSGITLQTRDNVSAGATGSLATTITRSGGADSAGWCGWVIAIKAASSGGQTVTIGLVSETNTALALTKLKRKAIGLATTTDTALAATRAKRMAIGLLTETDTALAVARAKRKTLGLSSETDTALPLVMGSTYAIGQASETDTALSLSRLKTKAIGLVTEANTALAVAKNKLKAIGQAVEAAAALALTRSKTRAAGLATETDAAFSLTHRKAKTIGLATETDWAFAVTVAGTDPVSTITAWLALRAMRGLRAFQGAYDRF